MKKCTLILFSFIVLISCRTNQGKIIPTKPIKLDNENILPSSDSILYWFDDDYRITGEIKFEKLSNVREKYSIKNGKLYDLKNKLIVDKFYISYHKDKLRSEDVLIVNGVPQGIYYNSIAALKDWRTFSYDSVGNLDGNFAIADYTTNFKKGSGYWKNYYFNNHNFLIKEEGDVFNNFKKGKWLYYSKEGKLIQTKNYKLKDSVDVRFPHCLFNKKEPCM